MRSSAFTSVVLSSHFIRTPPKHTLPSPDQIFLSLSTSELSIIVQEVRRMIAPQSQSWDLKLRTATAKARTVRARCSCSSVTDLTGSSDSSSNVSISCANPPKTNAATGLLQGMLEGQDEDGDDDEDSNGNGTNLNDANGQPNDGNSNPKSCRPEADLWLRYQEEAQAHQEEEQESRRCQAIFSSKNSAH